jgi:crotonobetainyl-CoA:carnitine CoA-transferase CaiB-like acyl-CoA transferase
LASTMSTHTSGTPTTPYGGLTVIELSDDPSGEMTGLQFVKLGAEVIKVEPPEGGRSRHTGPFVDDQPDPERSLAYWYYNGGKRSVVIDLEHEDGRLELDHLLSIADLFVVAVHPMRLDELGLDLGKIVAAHPRLIVVSITDFGLTGPWANYRSSDLVALATSGLLITSGYDDHSIPPIRPGGNQAYHTAASFGHQAALLGLLQRQQNGAGGLIDVSIQEAAAVTVELANPYWFYPRALVQRQTCRHAQPVPTQSAIFRCADDRWVYFALILSDPKPWNALVQWMDSHDLALDLKDSDYDALVFRQQNFAHIQDLVEVFFLLQDSSTAYHEGQRRGLPIGVLNAPEDLFQDEHLRAREFFQPVDEPGFGNVSMPAAPYRFSTMDTVSPRRAAQLGEDTASVLGDVPASSS